MWLACVWDGDITEHSICGTVRANAWLLKQRLHMPQHVTSTAILLKI